MKENHVHSRNIVKWAEDKDDVFVLSGDLTGSTEISDFKEAHPDKFRCVGMAEQNMMSFAGGMAREGYVPFVHTFSVFLTRRPYDQVGMSIAYPNLPVKLMGFLPGLLTPGGVTHQAIEDINLMRGMPNMTVLETGDVTDVESVLDVAYSINGPVYVRMLRGAIPRLFDTPMEFNKARILDTGGDVVVLTSGIMTEEFLRAKSALQAAGIEVTHAHITTLKPFSDPQIDAILTEAEGPIVTIENHTIYGGLGSAVAERMAELGVGKKLLRIGIPDRYAHGASLAYLLDENDMSAPKIAVRIGKVLGVTVTDDHLGSIPNDAPAESTISADQLEAL